MAITEEGTGEGDTYDQEQKGTAACRRESERVAWTECGNGNDMGTAESGT